MSLNKKGAILLSKMLLTDMQNIADVFQSTVLLLEVLFPSFGMKNDLLLFYL